MKNRYTVLIVAVATAMVALAGRSGRMSAQDRQAGQQRSARPSTQPPARPAAARATDSLSTDQRAMVTRYCITCHSERLKRGDLVLEQVVSGEIPPHADVWEKVIRKLRTGAMPPANMPHPDDATRTAFVKYLESSIDRAAAAHPNPGRTDAIHRLNRAEYGNAIRDLLAIDLDVSSMLPADDMSYGFDNIAGVLKVTSSLLDRYMVVARQVSRVAIGDPTLPPTAETFRLKADLSQDEAFDSLPMGTRGGTAIAYQFPLDAEYSIKVEPLGGGSETHELEISLDGERLKVIPLTPRSGFGVGQGYDSEAPAHEVRVPVQAGPHTVAVTFVKTSAALSEGVRLPFLAPHAEGAARTQPAVSTITITGPFDARGVGNTPSRQRIFTCRPAGGQADEARCARQILSALARRAYRRPVTEAEVGTLVGFYSEGRKTSGFDGAIELALRRLLMSTEFLFRVERAPASVAAGQAYQISDLDLASRLSFFIWSSIPDDELLDAAVKGTLRKKGVLEQQVRRMIADARASALSENFAGQWLQLRTIEGSSPNEYLFPNFGENLRVDFRKETELFFDSILRENRSVLDFLTADYTFINERLAKHYGIPNVYGSHFRRVTLTDPNRRGLLGQGSFLTSTSLADRTTVVARGKWILDNLLASPPAQPPPNVPPLKETTSDGRVLTLRERMDQHRADPVCASCHARMDPLGFALENFDATGQWRTREGDKPIDVSAVLFDGSKFEGPAGLRTWLVGQGPQIVSAITEKLLVYSLGRGLEAYDAPAVRQVVRDAAATNYRFSSLILGVAQSTPFQMRVK